MRISTHSLHAMHVTLAALFVNYPTPASTLTVMLTKFDCGAPENNFDMNCDHVYYLSTLFRRGGTTFHVALKN